MLFSYIKYEARNCMYGKLCVGLPSRNFGGLAKRGRSRYHSSPPRPPYARGVRRSNPALRRTVSCAKADVVLPLSALSEATLALAFARGNTVIARGRISLSLSILRTMSAQRPYKPVNVALAKVWKCRSNPISAAEAESFLASGSLSTSTAKTVIW